MKAKIIQAWAGDSISIRCRIYDEAGAEFDSSAFEIDGVELNIIGTSNLEGSISGNIAQVFIPADVLGAGKYEYYLQVKSSSTDTCFTIMTGTINVMELPQ